MSEATVPAIQVHVWFDPTWNRDGEERLFPCIHYRYEGDDGLARSQGYMPVFTDGEEPDARWLEVIEYKLVSQFAVLAIPAPENIGDYTESIRRCRRAVREVINKAVYAYRSAPWTNDVFGDDRGMHG